MRTQPPGTKRRLQSFHQVINTTPGFGRNRNATGEAPAVDRSKLRILQQINLVEHDDGLLTESIEFLNYLIDRPHLLVHTRMTQVDHMNKQIRFADFFEGGLERFD